MADNGMMNKPLDGAGLSVINSIFNERLGKKADASAVPTKVSDLQNDAGYITEADVPGGAAASNTVPRMDGTASPGTEATFARGDHVHPTDTSRLGAAGDGSQVTVSFNPAADRTAPESGDTLAAIMGKLAKNFADLGELAYRDGIGRDELDAAVKASLAKADTALQGYTETDPTVPAWAKEASKPTYSATEVGAIPLAMADSFARKSDVVGAYIYRGSVPDYTGLPTEGVAAGDVYNVEDTGMNYGWTGTAWDALGQTFQIEYLTADEVKAIMGA